MSDIARPGTRAKWLEATLAIAVLLTLQVSARQCEDEGDQKILDSILGGVEQGMKQGEELEQSFAGSGSGTRTFHMTAPDGGVGSMDEMRAKEGPTVSYSEKDGWKVVDEGE